MTLSLSDSSTPTLSALRWDIPQDRDALLARLLPPISEKDARRHGVFYTPAPIARRMVQQVLDPLTARLDDKGLLSIRILDPSCGIGVFLIEALFYLAEQLRVRHIDTSANRRALLRCLYGMDIDQHALATASDLILQSARSLRVDSFTEEEGPTLLNCHALFDSDELDPGLPLHREILSSYPVAPLLRVLRRSHTSGHATVDCVIGNPPYGLARGAQLIEAENVLLKDRYRQFRSGKLNKYLAFMARGLELLNEGGVLSFIVPNAWLGIQDGLAMRRFLFETGSLRSLEIHHHSLFPHLGVETVIFTAQKNAGASQLSIRRFSKKIPFENAHTTTLPYAVWQRMGDYRIPLSWSPQSERLHRELASTTVPLGKADSLFRPRIAMQAYATGKGDPPQLLSDVKNHVFHSDKKLNASYIPYIEGRGITRFQYSLSGRYLHYGPWLAEPQNLSRFSGPRLIIREILNPAPYLISAAYIEEQALYNKSVLHILPAHDCSREDLLSLLLILNSRFAGVWFTLFGRKSSRSMFPKLVNQDLKSFPLPANWHSARSRLNSFVAQLISIGEPPDETLEAAVLDAYGLDESLIHSLPNTSL